MFRGIGDDFFFGRIPGSVFASFLKSIRFSSTSFFPFARTSDLARWMGVPNPDVVGVKSDTESQSGEKDDVEEISNEDEDDEDETTRKKLDRGVDH